MTSGDVRSAQAPRSSDRGAAAIWVSAVAALVLVVGLAVVIRATAVLARHRAQDAADAAALAAASQIGVNDQICAAAARLATANRASLVGCSQQLAADHRSGTVEVSVSLAVGLPVVGRQTVEAWARAGRDPPGS